MTSNSFGRVRTCWSVMSAMASLTRILPARERGLLLGVRRVFALRGLGLLPLRPRCTSCRRTRARRARSPSCMNAPSVNFMMLPLWTKVTLLRLLTRAYSMAARTSRSVPSRLTGLMPMPVGRREADLLEVLRELLLEEGEELLRVLALGLELDAGVDVLRVLAEDRPCRRRAGASPGEGTPWNQRTGRRHT